MNTTRTAQVQDTTEHRPGGSRSLRIASSHPSLAPRVQQQTESRVQQRCYYAVFIILFVLTLLVNFISFLLFLIVDIEFKGDESIFNVCVLFVGVGDDKHSGAWSCDFVLLVKVLVLVITILVFILYLILIVRGMTVLSALRFLDMLVFFGLAILSCATGIILRLGLKKTCETSQLCDTDDRDFDSFFGGLVHTSEYTSYGLAVIYLFYFMWEFLLIVGYCVALSRRGPPQGEESLHLLNRTHSIYATMRNDDNMDTPFRNDNHL